MTKETFWMPKAIHATQISSMANLSVAASTDPVRDVIHQTGQVSFDHSKMQQIYLEWRVD
jgi:hypothetical protein